MDCRLTPSSYSSVFLEFGFHFFTRYKIAGMAEKSGPPQPATTLVSFASQKRGNVWNHFKKKKTIDGWEISGMLALQKAAEELGWHFKQATTLAQEACLGQLRAVRKADWQRLYLVLHWSEWTCQGRAQESAEGGCAPNCNHCHTPK